MSTKARPKDLKTGDKIVVQYLTPDLMVEDEVLTVASSEYCGRNRYRVAFTNGREEYTGSRTEFTRATD